MSKEIDVRDLESDARLVETMGDIEFNELSFMVMGDSRDEVIVADRKENKIISKLSFHAQVRLVNLLKKNLLMD